MHRSNTLTIGLVLFLLAACSASPKDIGCETWEGGGSTAWDRATRIKFSTSTSFIFDEGRLGSHQQVAVDPSGNAVVVWMEHNGTEFDIWAIRYTAGIGWGIATVISMGDSYVPQVGLDGNGNAIAVWIRKEGDIFSIEANHYTTSTGWGTATAIEKESGNAFDPQIAVDNAGNAIVAWLQEEGSTFSIWSNRYTIGSGWGTETAIEENAGDAANHQIAVDGNGNGMAVWLQQEDGTTSVWASRYTANGGWETATVIETSDNAIAVFDSRDIHIPRVAFDGNGNAIAVWRQVDDTAFSVWSNRYIADSGWETAVVVENDHNHSVRKLYLAVDGTGNAMVAWMQHVDIHANRYISGKGWETAELLIPGFIPTDVSAAFSSFTLSGLKADAGGRYLIFWLEPSAARVNQFYAKHYTPVTGWNEPEPVSFVPNYGSTKNFRLAVAMNASGTAFAAWHDDIDREGANGNCSASEGPTGFSVRANRRP